LFEESRRACIPRYEASGHLREIEMIAPPRMRIGSEDRHVLIRSRRPKKPYSEFEKGNGRFIAGRASASIGRGRLPSYLLCYPPREQKPPLPLTAAAHCCIEWKPQFVAPSVYCAQYRAAIAGAAKAVANMAVESAIAALFNIVVSPVSW
jgi:hypothetical protein